MTDTAAPLDTTPLKEKGIQIERSFFSEEVKQDLARRAEEVLRMRVEGKLTTDSQDAQGLPYEWFEPILKNEGIVAIMKDLFGPNLAGAGWRILIKDKHFRLGVDMHQDWPYNSGDTRKATVFVPLTRVNAANGGLIFLEESHQYGPVSMGPIDASRFPPMTEVCPDIDIGDLVICDFLTWHYSKPPQNDDDRIMIQLNYMPSSDPGSDNIIAGVRAHDKVLHSRFDAVSVPSIELNAKRARSYLEQGNVDRAERFARGMVTDDPDHVGAAVLLYDVLAQQNDPGAFKYLALARAASDKLQAAIVARERALTGAANAPASQVEDGLPWRPLDVSWTSYLPDYANTTALPARLGTPTTEWAYGAASQAIETAKPAAIRIKAKALSGKIGFCLITEDYGGMASDAHFITPESGDAVVLIAFEADKSPARLLVRNHNQPGAGGEVEIESVEILHYG